MNHHTKQARYFSPENGQEIIKGDRNKQTGMWEVPLETKQLEYVINDIIAQTTKP